MVDVLVPVDGSSGSKNALECAFDIFPNARFHVVHVLQVTEISSDPAVSSLELARERAGEIIEEASSIADAHERSIETAIVRGNASRAIVRYAEENDVDHVVIGSDGRSGIRRVLLGSVAETVARRSPTPVTIVR